MLAVAKAKASRAHGGERFSFELRAAEDPLWANDGQAGAFDVVVDTFGLCSFDDPVAALRRMAQACSPGGSVVLLEHGRSHYEFLNRFLDRNSHEHAKNWGCVWNRDILALVTEAGLDVQVSRRFHFGTTYYLKCKPRRAPVAE